MQTHLNGEHLRQHSPQLQAGEPKTFAWQSPQWQHPLGATAHQLTSPQLGEKNQVQQALTVLGVRPEQPITGALRITARAHPMAEAAVAAEAEALAGSDLVPRAVEVQLQGATLASGADKRVTCRGTVPTHLKVGTEALALRPATSASKRGISQESAPMSLQVVTDQEEDEVPVEAHAISATKRATLPVSALKIRAISASAMRMAAQTEDQAWAEALASQTLSLLIMHGALQASTRLLLNRAGIMHLLSRTHGQLLLKQRLAVAIPLGVHLPSLKQRPLLSLVTPGVLSLNLNLTMMHGVPLTTTITRKATTTPVDGYLKRSKRLSLLYLANN